MAEKDNHIDMNIEDVLIGKPHPFTVVSGKVERHFHLYPATFGKQLLLKRIIDGLGIKPDILKTNPYLEALRLATEKREDVCRLIAYHTFRTKEELFSLDGIERRVSHFKRNLDTEELATILIYILTRDNVEQYKQHLGITKENDRLRRVLEAKKSAEKHQNYFQFGGVSVFGSLLDVACERYKWTYDYVVWEVPYAALQLMLSDVIQNQYLSDEEKKKIPSRLLVDDKDVIRADDPKNRERILSMNWK